LTAFFIIQFEDAGYNLVSTDENFAKYASMGMLLTNYYALTHPSQPNYWTQVAGDYFNWASNADLNISAHHIGDLLEANGFTWKAYQEDWPGHCSPISVDGNYYRKHNPFISFDNVRNNLVRCNRHIVDASQLDIDIQNNALPQYSYYTPNTYNDGQDTGYMFAGRWLDRFLTPKLQMENFIQGTLVVITFDEDDGLENNHIYTALVGLMVPPNTTDATPYNHYSLLRTIEDNFSIGTLNKNDATATTFQMPGFYSSSITYPTLLYSQKEQGLFVPLLTTVISFLILPIAAVVTTILMRMQG